ncbi:MAG: hypothetical protein IKM31_03005, partial [Oscillospiraceae bacterium]|nr:hypothetical protein [Oscillospiraceae bacterium]
HPAEFFLETWTYQGRCIISEPLRAPDLDGISLFGRGRRACDLLIGEALEAGLFPERILSADHPEETAGMLLPERKLAVYERTAGEGLLPGVCEVELPVKSCREPDTDKKALLREIDKRMKNAGRRTEGMLKAARELMLDNERRQLNCTDREKVLRAAVGFFRKECAYGRAGTERRRFLTALTGHGFFSCTTAAGYDRAVLLEDPFGGTAAVFMSELRRLILTAGQGCVTCLDPLDPDRIAHLLLPEKGLCIMTSSPFLPLPALPEKQRRIHYTRFCDEEQLEPHRQKIRFIRRITRELLLEAESAAAEAIRAKDLLKKALPETDEAELLRLARKQMT